MRIGILGPLEVTTAGGEPVPVGGARLRTLLTRLALDVGEAVTVDSLAAALWPAGGPTDPAHAVQSLVTRLRRALPEPAVVRAVPGGYRLDLPPEAVDLPRFEGLAAEGREALRAGQPAAAAGRLREALALWRGEPLADLLDPAVTTRLRELRLSAIEDRVAAELAMPAPPDPSALVAELQPLITEHPLRERLRVQLVRALAAAGRSAEALATFQDYRRLLVDEFGTDPGPELQQAHRAVLRSDAEPRRDNLPAGLTSFVGRAEERARLAAQLATGRLVTLVGPGGSGKTRLATTFASGVTGDFPGGVWLVELAPVTGPEGVAPAMVAALGLPEPGPLPTAIGPRDPVSRLVEALSAAETLVVLDNCEHLVDAVARVADELLSRCPRLRVLATSREPLGILGEALCPVPPLDLPPAGSTVDEAVTYPAVRLFADRAAAVRPGFAVTGDNLAAVVETCRRLDGLPLAIELAAARLRTLPVTELAARLDDRLRLLASGRTVLPRHQTLAAVVGWSWDLLEPGEQRLARRLAVFPGVIAPDAAARVAGTGDIVDTLAGLVDKSLLQLVEGPQARYRMLETIREYALARLAEAGEADQIRAAHAGYFRWLAEQAAPHLRGGAGQVPWLARLAAAREDLLAALQFACGAGDAGTALRLAAALGHFWTIQGAHAEAIGWLRQALWLPGEAPAGARTAATAAYLFHTVLSGGPAEPVDELRALVGTADLTVREPGAATVAPLFALLTHDSAAGLAASADARSDPDPWNRAMVNVSRSFLHGNDGDLAAMAVDLAAAIDGFRAAGDRWGLSTALTYRAYAQLTRGEFEAAAAALSEAIPLLRELDPDDQAELPRVMLATVRARQGDLPRARAELRELVALERFASWVPVMARISLGDLARREGDLAAAAAQYRHAQRQLDRLPQPASLLRAMLGCATGQLAVAGGEFAEARRRLTEALALAELDMAIAADVGVAVAWLRWRGTEDATAAAVALGAAHALRGAADEFDPDVARLDGQLRAALGERAYRAAYQRGRSRDRAGALTELGSGLG